MAASNWTIAGSNQLAATLRGAAPYVETTTPIAITTEPGDVPPEAFVLGPAALHAGGGRVVPLYAAFEAVEEIAKELNAGSVGRIYGCYASLRVPRGVSGEDLISNALIPAVALVLDLLPGQPERVWARCATLMTSDDAWFVTIRFDDEVIATIEAMATIDTTPDRELLVELTGSERVLRAEPTRQAVVVERLGDASVTAPWWEDLGERYLQLLTRRVGQQDRESAAKLRNVWKAIQASAGGGKPVMA